MIIGSLTNQQDNRLDLAMMELKVNDVKLFLFWAYLLFLGLTVTTLL